MTALDFANRDNQAESSIPTDTSRESSKARSKTLRTVVRLFSLCISKPRMENPVYDPDNMESVAGQLAEGFDDINEVTVVNKASSVTASVATGSPVRLSRVSTYVLATKVASHSFGYIVSSMASHWGVVVGEGPERTLYHLVFQNRADTASDANPDSITGRVRAVMFDAGLWRSEMGDGASMYDVGKTRYEHRELLRIGTMLVDPTNRREQNDRGVRRLSPRVLELPNVR